MHVWLPAPPALPRPATPLRSRARALTERVCTRLRQAHSRRVALLLSFAALPLLLSTLLSWGTTAGGERESTPSPSDRRLTPVVRVVEGTVPAVVALECLRMPDGAGDGVKSGSGVLINSRGFLLSNLHVVRGAHSIRVRLSTGESREGVLEAVSEASDLALVRILSEREDFPYIPLGSSGDLLPGETVIAVGNPYGFQHTVSTGVVSATRRTFRLPSGAEYNDFIQTDAAINPGNSGGGLVNLDGELIGVNTAIFNQGWGIAFAIPVDRIKDLLASYVRKEHALGVEVVPEPQGLRVSALTPDGCAARAGLAIDDVLLTGNGQPLRSRTDLTVASLGATAEQPLLVRLRRAGEEFILPVGGVSLLWSHLGVRGEEDVVRQADGGVLRGLQLTRVRADGPADRAGLARGDLVQRVVVLDEENSVAGEFRIRGEQDLQSIVERYSRRALRVTCWHEGRRREVVLNPQR